MVDEPGVVIHAIAHGLHASIGYLSAEALERSCPEHVGVDGSFLMSKLNGPLRRFARSAKEEKLEPEPRGSVVRWW